MKTYENRLKLSELMDKLPVAPVESFEDIRKKIDEVLILQDAAVAPFGEEYQNERIAIVEETQLLILWALGAILNRLTAVENAHSEEG